MHKMKRKSFGSLLVCIVWLCLGVAAVVRAQPPESGPYLVDAATYVVETLDGRFNEVIVYYPRQVHNNVTFPFLSFAHGFAVGGPLTAPFHFKLLRSVASHGYIIGANKSCMLGCRDGNWYDEYWREQLKVIDWARSPEMENDPVIGHVDHSYGYGIFGHSMGGQATARSAMVADEYSIKAAIALHPYSDFRDGNSGKDIECPFAGFTGTEDNCCGGEETHRYYDPARVPKTLANLVGAGHMEPNVLDTRWPPYIAAYFKVWLENDQGTYHSLIYNATDPNGLCNYYEMAECVHENL